MRATSCLLFPMFFFEVAGVRLSKKEKAARESRLPEHSFQG
jgi:hypothetical protein